MKKYFKEFFIDFIAERIKDSLHTGYPIVNTEQLVVPHSYIIEAISSKTEDYYQLLIITFEEFILQSGLSTCVWEYNKAFLNETPISTVSKLLNLIINDNTFEDIVKLTKPDYSLSAVKFILPYTNFREKYLNTLKFRNVLCPKCGKHVPCMAHSKHCDNPDCNWEVTQEQIDGIVALKYFIVHGYEDVVYETSGYLKNSKRDYDAIFNDIELLSGLIDSRETKLALEAINEKNKNGTLDKKDLILINPYRPVKNIKKLMVFADGSKFILPEYGEPMYQELYNKIGDSTCMAIETVEECEVSNPSVEQVTEELLENEEFRKLEAKLYEIIKNEVFSKLHIF